MGWEVETERKSRSRWRIDPVPAWCKLFTALVWIMFFGVLIGFKGVLIFGLIVFTAVLYRFVLAFHRNQ